MSKLRHLKWWIIFIGLATQLTSLATGIGVTQDQSPLADALKLELHKRVSQNHSINFDYKKAREILFGELDLKSNSSGYYLVDRYCNIVFTASDGVGPGKIPNSSVLNCEHTWPQSKFSPNFPKDTQKNDLHHLYAVYSRANSSRGNIPFGEVVGNYVSSECKDSYRGEMIGNEGERAFEPPKEHRGNVARALFYFSTRYLLEIDDKQEYYLRKWHHDDPVDQEEIERNEKIYRIQFNKNPFIENPNLVDSIKNF